MALMYKFQEYYEAIEWEMDGFDKIEPKLSDRRDLHGFLRIAQLFPSTRDIVQGADHDVIYLDLNPEEFDKIATPELVEEFYRCGIIWMGDCDSFGMFA